MANKTLNLLLMTALNGIDTNDFLHKKLRRFKTEEDISVNIDFVSWNRAYETIIRAHKEGNPPDVFELGTTWISPLKHLEYITPLDKVSISSSFVPWMNELCRTEKDKFITAPWTVNNIVMLARRDCMDRLDVKPEDIRTWSGFHKVVKMVSDLRKEGEELPVPTIFAARPEIENVHRLIAWLFAANFRFPDLTSKPEHIFQTDTFFEVIKYIEEIVKLSDVSIEDIDKTTITLNDEFFSEKRYMFYTGNLYLDIDNFLHNNNGEFILAPIPSPEGSMGGYAGGSVLGVSSRTKYPGRAQRLLQYLSSPDFLQEWHQYTNVLPAVETKLWKDRSGSSIVDDLYNLLKYSSSYPVHPAWRNFERTLSEGLSWCLWHVFVDADLDIETRISSIIKNMDKQISELLNMSWEMH
ncbi:MAG: extracellular solute-binding protein [Halanaerobiaceae bacterium]